MFKKKSLFFIILILFGCDFNSYKFASGGGLCLPNNQYRVIDSVKVSFWGGYRKVMVQLTGLSFNVSPNPKRIDSVAKSVIFVVYGVRETIDRNRKYFNDKYDQIKSEKISYMKDLDLYRYDIINESATKSYMYLKSDFNELDRVDGFENWHIATCIDAPLKEAMTSMGLDADSTCSVYFEDNGLLIKYKIAHKNLLNWEDGLVSIKEYYKNMNCIENK